MDSKKRLFTEVERSMLTAYLICWAIAVGVFWCLRGAGGAWAMLYSMLVLWLFVPGCTFVVSLLCGIHECRPAFCLLLPLGMGLMAALVPYFTFSLANMISNFNSGMFELRYPDMEYAVVGIIASSVGVLLGVFCRCLTDRFRKMRQ